MAGTEGNMCPRWAPRSLSAALIMVSTCLIKYYDFAVLFYFSMFSKSTSCLSSLNQGTNFFKGGTVFPLLCLKLPHSGSLIIISRCYCSANNKWQNLFHKDYCSGWLQILSLFPELATVISELLKSIHLISAWRRNVFYFSANDQRCQKVVDFSLKSLKDIKLMLMSPSTPFTCT